MPTKERLAFDLSLYPFSEPVLLRRRLETDLAFYVIDQGNIEPQKRTTLYTFTVTEDGRVIDDNTRQNLLSCLSEDTLIDILETAAARTSCEFFIKNSNGFSVWLSPLGSGYTESRIIISQIKQEGGKKKVVNYNVCGNLAFNDCALIWKKLASLFAADSTPPKGDDALRKTPFFASQIPEGVGTLEILEVVRAPREVWINIENGEVMEKIEQAKKDASEVVQMALPQIIRATGSLDYVRNGALLETLMSKRGWHLQANGPCGLTNLYLVEKQARAPGNILEIFLRGKFVQKCPFCHTEIQKIIEPGYRCSCGRAYLGLC